MNISKEVKQLIESKVVALGAIDGKYPDITPVLYCKVMDGLIIISHVYMETAVKNIIKEGIASIAVWDDEKNKEYGYKMYGKAEYINQGKWLEFVKNIKENKDLKVKGAIVFTPIEIKKI